MIAGTREKKTIGSYKNDPLYAFSKAFTETVENILVTEHFDIFDEVTRAIRRDGVKESLKEFFVENFVDENDPTKSAEEIEADKEEVEEMFENDVEAMQENTTLPEYSPMVGMALPIHKLILMNNVFANGGGIQKATAVQPSFTVSLERRLLVTPEGKEIDMFLQQNMVADAVEASAPIVDIDVDIPQTTPLDVIGKLGGTTMDKISMETHISGIYVQNVYIAEGDVLPDENGWYRPRGEVATASTAGMKNVWFPVKLNFTPTYGGPNKLDRIISQPIEISYKSAADGTISKLSDTLFASLKDNDVTITSVNGKIKKVKLSAKLDTSNAMLDMCSVKWDLSSDYVEIPDATPINTTVSPNEVKDIAAMHNANQVTKIIGITKTVLSEYKDKKIKKGLDNSFIRMDNRNSFVDEFDFARPEGYALDWVTHRQATFMDFLEDLATKMLQVLNDPNMTITVYGDPRIVRKITPQEYVYEASASIGEVTLDYTRTIVNSKDNRIYNFVGSDKLRNTNELMIILNPRNTDRICYRIYDYQMYISNEIRNSANPALPAIHSFERFKFYEYMPVQSRVSILNPSGHE